MKLGTIGLSLFLILLVLHTRTNAQTATYKDVLVVINNSSTISDSVGSYFVNVHRIPQQNIARITAPTTEEIDSVQFEDLRLQIETILVTRNIKDSINYIVTTKGVPLKVRRYTINANSSVESELSLILSPYAYYIGRNGRMNSPYYNQRQDFTRAKYGIYLVTRLDGYSYSDIRALIDRSSAISRALPANANFVFDQDPTYNSSIPYLNTNMTNASAALRTRGQNVILDNTTTYLTHLENVLGYISWGSNDRNQQRYTTNARPFNTYAAGALAETYVSTSARSFMNPTAYGQSLIADLIAEGVTAVKGYTYEPYSNAMADASILFPMYTDGYTVAEAFYASSYFLSWMDIIIGDPKFRIISTRMPADTGSSLVDGGATALPVQITSFHAIVDRENIVLRWNTATETACYGFDVERRKIQNSEVRSQNTEWSRIGFVKGAGTSNAQNEYSFRDEKLTVGSYVYRLKQIDNDGNSAYYRSNEVTIISDSKKLTLADNYPNPFNPSTKIHFAVTEAGHTSLRIYNILGQTVATLFNQMTAAGENHQVTFDASSFPSGTYYARLESGDQVSVKRMILAK